jgi:sugar-specific transcriptional regulator TrmB
MEKTVQEFLNILGLTEDEVKIYLALNQSGPATILELSRRTGINRTKIYRTIEVMQQKGLAEEIIDEHKKYIKAIEADNLELLIKEEESKAKYLREIYPSVSNLLITHRSASQPGTKVLFYRGKEGVRQQVWNTLRTKGELLGYSYRPLSELIGKYYEEWYEEWMKRDLRMRDIYSDSYLKGKRVVKQKIDSLDFKSKNIISRYVPSKILSITHQMDIYNEVVSIYHWYEGEVFGVEIYNEKVASFQKQLFEIVWRMAK